MSLLTDLISYWKLDEASGSRPDSHGSNTLTDSGSTGSTTGKIGSAANFAGTTRLSHADNPDLSAGDVPITFACWVQFGGGMVGTEAVASKHNGASAAGSEWLLSRNGTSVRLEVYSGSSSTLLSASAFGAITSGVWYYIIWWHDPVTNEIGISINGVENTASWSLGINDTTQAYTLAALSVDTLRLTGAIDEVGWWKRVLTSGERSQLYNSGSGLPYSGFSGSIVPLLTHRSFMGN